MVSYRVRLILVFVAVAVAVANMIVAPLWRFTPSFWMSEEAAGGATTTATPKDPRFAYVFVVSGCTDESCMGYILNCLVAAQILQEYNSTADVVLKVQMASAHERHLPLQQETWLASAGIQLHYLNSTDINNFGMATLLKFRVLQMMDYDRVLFVDADIVPLCNLDYLFHESFEPDGMLQDNVVMSGTVAPATAAMFLVKPEIGEFERIIDLVREYRRTHPGRKTFDRDHGWGQQIVPPDKWYADWMRKDGYHWDYKAANSDQGLLHHWIRYMKMNYTQLLARTIQTWQEVTYQQQHLYNDTFTTTTNQSVPVVPIPGGTGQPRLLAKIREVEARLLPTCGGASRFRNRNEYGNAPYSDFIHFGGGDKPWNRALQVQDMPLSLPNKIVARQNMHLLWMHHLAKANATFGLGFNSTIVVKKGSPFGQGASDADVLDPELDLPVRKRHR